MAIWQKRIIIVPTEIPEMYNNVSLKALKSISDLWKEKQLNSKLIIAEIDTFINRTNNLNIPNQMYWKGETTKYEDNDVYISFSSKNKFISNIEFRFDLRTESFVFIENMISICNRFSLGFLSNDGEIIIPKVSDYKTLIINNSFYKSKFPDYSK